MFFILATFAYFGQRCSKRRQLSELNAMTAAGSS
jgi:hypothetical protein